MSLLIDALKKAEQEKKEAARRLKEAEERSGEGIKLEPSTVTTRAETASSRLTPDDGTENTPQSGLSINAENIRTADYALSPLEEYTLNRTSDLESTAAGANIRPSRPSLSLQNENTHNAATTAMAGNQADSRTTAVSADKTFTVNNLTIEESATTPLDDTGPESVKENLANTLNASRALRPVVTAAQLVKDMGGGKTAPTPVAAQTVFTAVNTSSGKRQVLEWVMFLGLFAAILAAGGALYYLKITPSAPETSSPLVARGIEAELQPAVIVPLPDVMTETGTAPTPEATDTTEVAATPATVPEVAAVEGEIAQDLDQESKLDTGTAAPVQELPAPETVTQTEAVAAVDVSLPEAIPVDEKAIAISRSRSVDQHDQLINRAYADYSAGNYSSAESTYKQVLETMPGNRDALLGMAALAYRKGQAQQAYEIYLRVLKLYPRDIVATAALINIQGSTDLVRSETVLKLMIQDQPEVAFLYFALGNNYASQSRWADAQSAFFEAYRREPGNGDFTYNLAVSLDRLGQAGAALDYYQKALDLADLKEPGFNTASVLARVSSLSAQPQPGQ